MSYSKKKRGPDGEGAPVTAEGMDEGGDDSMTDAEGDRSTMPPSGLQRLLSRL